MATLTIDLQPYYGLTTHDDITNPARPNAARGSLLFSASQTEEMIRIFRMPTNYASDLTLKFDYSMVSAISGNVDIVAKMVAVTDGDAQAIDAKAYDSDNSSGAITVPGTVDYLDGISITMTNADSVAARDYVKIMIFRDHDSANDTATGDLECRDAVLEATTT